MTDLPPPPHPLPQPSSQARVHPLAIASLVLSILGFVPLVIVGGLLGALLGAVALGSIRRHPDRFRGAPVAVGGLAVGMVSGVLVLATFSIVRSDDWGWTPLIATGAYAGLVVGVAAVSHTTPGRAGAAAVVGVTGVLAAVLVVIALVLLITLAFTTIFEGFLDTILGRD